MEENTTIKLTNVRLSFPSLFKREVFNGKEGKFSATFLLDKTTHENLIDFVTGEMIATAKLKFKGTALPKTLKLALVDGDEKDLDGYENCMSLKAGSNSRPTVINSNKAPLAEDDGVIYAGCYVNAIVDFWVQDNEFGKRVNCNLIGVQFAGKGEPFGRSAIDVTDQFDVVATLDDDI